MSDYFGIEVEDRASDRFENAERDMTMQLATVSEALAAGLLMRARQKASGDLVQVHTGEFVASLYTRTEKTGRGVVVELGSNSPKAVILEYGATIPPHEILPTAAKALSFGGGVGEVYAEAVEHPGAKIAPRRVLRSTLDGSESGIMAGMTSVLDRFVEKAS